MVQRQTKQGAIYMIRIAYQIEIEAKCFRYLGHSVRQWIAERLTRHSNGGAAANPNKGFAVRHANARKTQCDADRRETRVNVRVPCQTVDCSTSDNQ